MKGSYNQIQYQLIPVSPLIANNDKISNIKKLLHMTEQALDIMMPDRESYLNQRKKIGINNNMTIQRLLHDKATYQKLLKQYTHNDKQKNTAHFPQNNLVEKHALRKLTNQQAYLILNHRTSASPFSLKTTRLKKSCGASFFYQSSPLAKIPSNEECIQLKKG